MDYLTALVTEVLAISLAAERVVALVKSLAPSWFADDPTNAARPAQERWRQFRVQLVAILASWATATLLVDGNVVDPFGKVIIVAGHPGWPAWLVGLLASGGSAFWSSILSYTKAVKDIKVQDRTSNAADALTANRTLAVAQARDSRTSAMQLALQAPQPALRS